MTDTTGAVSGNAGTSGTTFVGEVDGTTVTLNRLQDSMDRIGGWYELVISQDEETTRVLLSENAVARFFLSALEAYPGLRTQAAQFIASGRGLR